MPSRAHAWTLRYLRLCGVALPLLLVLHATRGPTVREPAVSPTADDALHAVDATPARWRGFARRGRQLLRARDIFGKKETERRPRSRRSESRHLPAFETERRGSTVVRADATPENLRLLYAIMAYDRKQHIHLLTMLHSAVSMCEGGLRVTILLYTADSNPYTPKEREELQALCDSCTGRTGGTLALENIAVDAQLKFDATMQHRKEFLRRIDEYDLFVYSEDDVHIELRHIAAYVEASSHLARSEDGHKYVLGWQRLERNGIGLGAEHVMWENGVDNYHGVEVGGRLYATMVNPHAGAWMATRSELKAHHKQCRILHIPKTAGSFTRVRAGGWNLYMNCGRRKVLPVRNFQNFLVHHLPDKNWWQRSECAVAVPDLLAHFRDWSSRYSRGDRSMVCGRWWIPGDFCRDELQVVPAGERKKRFGIKGSCTVWRNRTSGEETITLPNEKMKRLAAIVQAKEDAGARASKSLRVVASSGGDGRSISSRRFRGSMLRAGG